MTVPAAQSAPPVAVLAVAAVAALVLLVLVARTFTDFVIGLIQLGVILAALGVTLALGAFLLKRVRP